MTKDWVHGVGHSPVCQILLQIVVPLHLLGPVLLGCCRLQLTSLSSMIVLQPSFLCEGWGGHPLCLSGYSSVMMDLSTELYCTQYIRSIHPSIRRLFTLSLSLRLQFVSSPSVYLFVSTSSFTHSLSLRFQFANLPSVCLFILSSSLHPQFVS